MIFCTINNKKYRVLFCKDSVTFFDNDDESVFLTTDNSRKLSSVIKSPFFLRR